MNKRKYVVNNGQHIKFIYDLNDIPEGFVLGNLPTTSNYIWITNGVNQKTIPKDEVIPDGWRRGRLKFSEQTKAKLSKAHIGEINITDGEHERHIKANDTIPDGWYVGKSNKMKQKLSNSCKGRINITNGETMTHIMPGDIIPDGFRRGNVDVSQETREKLRQIALTDEVKQKKYNTQKKNNSFILSDPEEKYYQYLLTIYNKDDIVRQYKDHRYPFLCDFYIKSKDLFIECNFHWTHGLHPFDSTNESDIKRKNELEQKSLTSKYCKQALYVWTDLDVRKLKIAKENNLNYQALYNSRSN